MTGRVPVSPTNPVLEASGLVVAYHGPPVVRDVHFALHPGELVGVVGPNGCGKSTLLKTLSGEMRPRDGQVLLHDEPIGDIAPRRRARTLAMLPQHPDAPPGMSVGDLIRCGRSPHCRWFERLSAEDQQVVDEVVRRCSLEAFVHRPVAELSGGERQRAWLAMTLAQQPSVLLLDEPTAALDINHQLEVMELLSDLTTTMRLATAIVLHDINLAIRFCTRIVVMRDGRILGPCPLSSREGWGLIEQAFDVSVEERTAPSPAGSRQLTFSRR